MINQLSKGLVDLIYGTGRARRMFERDNPNEKVLAADASKGMVVTEVFEKGFKVLFIWELR